MARAHPGILLPAHARGRRSDQEHLSDDRGDRRGPCAAAGRGPRGAHLQRHPDPVRDTAAGRRAWAQRDPGRVAGQTPRNQRCPARTARRGLPRDTSQRGPRYRRQRGPAAQRPDGRPARRLHQARQARGLGPRQHRRALARLAHSSRARRAGRFHRGPPPALLGRDSGRRGGGLRGHALRAAPGDLSGSADRHIRGGLAELWAQAQGRRGLAAQPDPVPAPLPQRGGAFRLHLLHHGGVRSAVETQDRGRDRLLLGCLRRRARAQVHLHGTRGPDTPMA